MGINGFVKWLLFMLLACPTAMFLIDREFSAIDMPAWAIASITILFAIGPVSPALIAGKNVFSKSFRISDQ